MTGYAPCWDCPYHFYQSYAGQTSCDRCLGQTVLEQTGATQSGACDLRCKYKTSRKARKLVFGVFDKV